MNEAANFIPATNGELHDYEVRYRVLVGRRYQERTHTVKSKSAVNALASFGRAVRHEKILGVTKVVAE